MVLYNYIFIGLLLLVAVVFALAPVLIEWLIAPRKRTLAKGDTYECGVKTYGETWVRFRIQYYIYALMFVVFDIETVFLFPWAVSYGWGWGLSRSIEMVVFLVILAGRAGLRLGQGGAQVGLNMRRTGRTRGSSVWRDLCRQDQSWSSSAIWTTWIRGGLLWLAVGFFGVFPGIVAYMVWLERKVAARFQDRIGPNRVGPLGLLQPIADAIKLITKEDLVPRDADRCGPPAGAGARDRLGVSGDRGDPVRDRHGAGEPASGMVYLVAVSSMSPLGIFLAGWSSRNKYSLLGAMRSVAQLVSYEVPQVLSTVPIVLWAGSLSLVTIFDKQVEFGWFIFSPPGLLAFVILLIASIAEVNRTPFDLPEAESEIIAGYHTEYSGMRFGLFFLAEYLSVFAVSCLATALFLGGGTPIPFVEFPTTFLTRINTVSAYILVDMILLAGLHGQGAVLHLPDVLDQGDAAADAGRPADEFRVEVPGAAGDRQRPGGGHLVRDRDPAGLALRCGTG